MAQKVKQNMAKTTNARLQKEREKTDNSTMLSVTL